MDFEFKDVIENQEYNIRMGQSRTNNQSITGYRKPKMNLRVPTETKTNLEMV